MADFSSEYFDKMKKALEEVNKLQNKSQNTRKEQMDLEREFIKLYEEQGEAKRRIFETDRQSHQIFGKTRDILKNISEATKDSIKARRSLNKDLKLTKKLEKDLNSGKFDANDKLKAMMTENLAQRKLENTYTSYQVQALTSSIPLVGKLLSKFGGWVTAAYKIYKFFQDIFNSVVNIGKFIGSKLLKLFDATLDKVLKMDSAAGNIAANIGLSSQQAEYLKRDINEMTLATLRFGGSVEDVAKVYESFAETTGRIQMFNERDIESATRIGLATKLGAEGLTDMVASFDLVGASFEKTISFAEDTMDLSAKMSLNSTKLLKSTQQLVEDFKGFNFKGGLQDLTEMAAKAQSLRFDLGNMRSMSDNLFSVEGAVEAASKLRVLGGTFSQIADPITMMYNAINDPEALSNSVLESLKGIAQKNEKGFFFIPPAQRKIVELAAEALGQDSGELTNAAIKQAELADKIKAAGAGFLSDSERSVFGNLVKLTDEGYQINGRTIESVRGNVKLIKQMVKSQQLNEEAAQKRMNFMQRIYKMGDMLLLGFTPILERITSVLTDTSSGVSPIERMSRAIAGTSERISEIIKKIFDGDNLFMKMTKKFTNYIGTLADKFAAAFEGVNENNFITKVTDILAKSLTTVMSKILPVIGGFMIDGWNKTLGDTWLLPKFDLPDKYTELMASVKTQPQQNDFIYSQKEGLFSFNKDDLIIGGTGLMDTSRSDSSGGSDTKNLNINVTGTLTINGDGQSVTLSPDDLKQAGIVALSRAVAVELHKYDRGTYKDDKRTKNKPL